MTRDEAVDLLMGRLAKRVSSITQQDIINEMVFVQETVLEEMADPFWFMLSAETDLSTVANQEYVNLPSGFLMEWEDGALYVVEDDGSTTEMVRDDYDILRAKYTGTGRPKYYDLAGTTIVLRKIPDAVYTLKYRFFEAQASLAGAYGGTGSGVENAWLRYAADLLMAEVGIIIAKQYLMSDPMVQMFVAQRQTAYARLRAKDIARQESNKKRAMGDD